MSSASPAEVAGEVMPNSAKGPNAARLPFLTGLTGSASLIGAISAKNAEFSQDNRKGTRKRAHQGLDFGGGPGLEITA
jgi:hypothetical protein